MLDRVSISQSVSDADTVIGMSPKTSTAPTIARSVAQPPDDIAREEELSQEDVPDVVADEVATGEDAAPEDETEEEEAAEEEQEPPIPSPITRDMYVRLVQQFTDKQRAPDKDFLGGISRINCYRKRIAERLYLERAKALVETDHAFSEDVVTEYASSSYGSDLCCDGYNETSSDYHHCVICNNGNYDICQNCIDKEIKCPGDHPLAKITNAADENTEYPPRAEDESLFPVADPLGGFDVNDPEFIIRTLYLAALLG